MNSVQKRIRNLESKVVSDEPEGKTTIVIHNKAERALHFQADQFAEKIRKVKDASYWEDSNIPVEERNRKAEQLFAELLTPQELELVKLSHELFTKRVRSLYLEIMEASLPKMWRSLAFQRLLWFERELRKLGYMKYLEDEEFEKRDEQAADFDDIKWWEEFDKKILAIYPEGIFTEKSWQLFEEKCEEIESKLIRQYYEEHPEKLKELQERLKNAEEQVTPQ